MTTDAHTACALRSGCRLDEEIVEFRWGPDHIGTSATVTVDVTVEPDSLIAVYPIKRAGKTHRRCGE
jgi:hypothetical protein